MPSDSKSEKPVYCGNFEYDATEREIERLFDKYGDVDRVDMKTGFAFVYMKSTRDADEAIRKLDGKTFGVKARRLVVEWAKNAESTRRKRDVKPNSTLFVANFDQRRTRESDLSRLFERYGKLLRVQIKRNYAFVQFETVDRAKRALEETDGAKLLDRRISVEYVAKTDPASRTYSRSRSRSPRRSASRSRSPARRRRSSSRSPSRSRSRSPARSASPVARSLSPEAEPRSISRSPSRSRSRTRSP